MGRARRPGRRRRRPRCSSIHPAVVADRGPHATSSACAACVDADGDADRAGAGVPRLPRRPADRRSTSIEARRAGDGGRVQRARATPASSATTCSWRGLHRRQHRATSPSGCCTSATTRSAALGDASPPFTVTAAIDARRPRRRSHRGRRPPDRRHVHRAELPHRRRRRRATASTTRGRHRRPSRTRCRRRTASLEAPFVCNVPDAVMARHGAGPARPVRPRPARQRARDQRRQRPRLRQRAQRRVLRDEVGRHERGRHPQRRRLARATCRTSRRMADRLQQGVLNQIVLGRLMLAADGLVADPAFQRADGSVDRRHRRRSSSTATARAGSWA